MRQAIDSDVSDKATPIFGLEVVYRPADATTITLSGDRRLDTSFITDRLRTSTEFVASVRQRFYDKYRVTLHGGYERSEYDETRETGLGGSSPLIGLTGDREDDILFFGVRASRTVLENGEVAIFYEHHENHSNVSQLDFKSDQVGVELSYRF